MCGPLCLRSRTGSGVTLIAEERLGKTYGQWMLSGECSGVIKKVRYSVVIVSLEKGVVSFKVCKINFFCFG